MRLADRGDHGRPIVRSSGAGTDAIAPGSCEDVIHDQHGHVATDAVALLGDLVQRLDHRARAGLEQRR